MYSVYFDDEKRANDMPHAEDAAMLVSCLGDGAEIRYMRSVVWKEGEEDQPAGESYDHAAEVIDWRVRAIIRKRNERNEDAS